MRRTRCLPLPDGGRKSVQPVHVDDVAAAVVSAVQRPWSAAVALPLPGPTTLTWREMALQAAAAAGLRPLPLPVPVAPLIGLADLLKRFGVPIDSHTMRRFRESIVLPAEPAAAALGLTPRDFHTGIRQAVAAWAADGAAGPRRAVDRR
jgi:nucleoside-diphosphate-sugar epimerase